jgi:hypothetical protein
MHVAVPYIEGMLHPRTLPSIAAQGYAPHLYVHDRTPGIAPLYRHLFLRMFASGEDVAIVEQDKESRSGFLASYEECPMAVCFHGYQVRQPFDQAMAGATFASFGHIRFRGHLGARLLELTETDRWKNAHRSECEGLVAQWLKIKPCLHPGEVVHHHPSYCG